MEKALEKPPFPLGSAAHAAAAAPLIISTIISMDSGRIVARGGEQCGQVRSRSVPLDKCHTHVAVTF